MTNELDAVQPAERHPYLELEYAQINDNIRFLADVRFKLLAILPALGVCLPSDARTVAGRASARPAWLPGYSGHHVV